MSSLAMADLPAPGGFVADPRFGGTARPAAAGAPEPAPDPAELAWDEGFAAGLAEGTRRGDERCAEVAAAAGQLGAGLARCAAEDEELLRQRLTETVAALCEAAIAPLALDREALAGRVRRAAALLTRSTDQRTIHLHPDDIVMLGGQLPADWPVHSDPALERGAVRIETAEGGVEDGPANWRRAIAEALGRC